jgi:hypothetical protein
VPASATGPKQPGKSELILVLSNDQPLLAADLAELFGNLARDYRKISRGGSLVVDRLIEGSLFAHFKDANSQGPSASNLISFAKTLSSLVATARHGGREAAKAFAGRRRAGVRSVESIIKTAVNSRSRVELDYKGADGEQLKLKIEPMEAITLQRTVAEAIQQRDPKADDPAQLKAQRIADDDLGRMVERLAKIDASDTDDANEQLLKAVVHALATKGLIYLVEEIATNFERQGSMHVANKLRKMVKDSVGGNLRPLHR